MALKRVTMQDIAKACGLSRNTVSKVFNNRGAVPESRREAVLKMAKELGYYRHPDELLSRDKNSGSIALLTQRKPIGRGFHASFITSFTDQISRAGFTLKLYEISSGEVAGRRLPPHLNLSETAGILCIEVFDREYYDMICALGKPTVFVDGFAGAARTPISCDFISMENIASETVLVKSLIAAGARSVGFVGDREHCNSFHERYASFCLTLQEAGLTLRPELSILEKDGSVYSDTEWLMEKLMAMPVLPDGFVCANDFLAIHLMTALKKMGLSIPGDVMVAGFDGSMEGSLVEPSLTTARIPTQEIGRLAASVLSERIAVPDLPYRWIYVKTTPVLGDSVR